MTSAERITAAASAGACNAAVLLKPNQAGTITETHAALRAARASGWSSIVSARSGETEDMTIVHLAVGWAAGQLKVGSCARSSARRSGTRRCASKRRWEIERPLGGCLSGSFSGRQARDECL